MSARPLGKRASLRFLSPAEKAQTRPLFASMPHIHFRGLLRLICRPGRRLNLDSVSDHMLRDIGIDPADRAESGIAFWRRR